MGIFKHFAALLICIAAALPILAHRQPEALTSISFNENTETWEIVHRFHAHDAERAMALLRKETNFDLEDLEDRARFALYVEASFEIRDARTNETVSLSLVGAELDDQDILVFQETQAQLTGNLAIRNNALRELFPRQTNTVNLSNGSTTRTLVFSGEDRWKRTELGE